MIFKITISLQQYDLSSQSWHDNADISEFTAIKSFYFKNHNMAYSRHLKIEKSQYILPQNG